MYGFPHRVVRGIYWRVDEPSTALTVLAEPLQDDLRSETVAVFGVSIGSENIAYK